MNDFVRFKGIRYADNGIFRFGSSGRGDYFTIFGKLGTLS